ncbi:hypothetical protein QWY79_15135 [Halomonas sabkhae]|uniref:hypothetical protein n=1 Tax=Halomonas sabkhae TaxID=626223 RepID=UPI0025B5DECF|nr:hypothetical protein [Halomonas sabkhae]MDN3526604.1 hypothetical protein [Halomonas sabkhae]
MNKFVSGAGGAKLFAGLAGSLMLAAGVLASTTVVADQGARYGDPYTLSLIDTDEGWAWGGHAGQAIYETVKSGEAFDPFAWQFKDYKIVSTGLQKELVDLWGYSKIYAEANVSYIWGNEEYYEAFLTPSISWEHFMWDDTIDTTAYVGVGMSYTSEASKLDDSGKRWMVSMIFELEGQPAAWGPWSIYGRLHHRSTAGIINDGDGGSNIPSLGVRYHFD